jgi:hypothetical protein
VQLLHGQKTMTKLRFKKKPTGNHYLKETVDTSKEYTYNRVCFVKNAFNGTIFVTLREYGDYILFRIQDFVNAQDIPEKDIKSIIEIKF